MNSRHACLDEHPVVGRVVQQIVQLGGLACVIGRRRVRSASVSEQGTGADQANVILGIVFRQFADHVDGGADLHRS